MPRLLQRSGKSTRNALWNATLNATLNATRNAALGLVLLASLTAPAQAQLTTFDFSQQPLGTTVPFSETRNGITATFTSPFGPGALAVETSPYSFLSGNVLGSTSPDGAALDVTFSQPLVELGYDFASVASPNSRFGVAFYSDGVNGTPFDISETSSGNGGGDLVSGTPFDAVEFFTTSTSHSFAVGYLAAGVAPVPEASSALSFGLLLALGLGGVVLRRLRRC